MGTLTQQSLSKAIIGRVLSSKFNLLEQCVSYSLLCFFFKEVSWLTTSHWCCQHDFQQLLIVGISPPPTDLKCGLNGYDYSPAGASGDAATSVQNRILGGAPARSDEFPWQVRIVVRGTDGEQVRILDYLQILDDLIPFFVMLLEYTQQPFMGKYMM